NALRTAFNPKLANIFAQQARGLSGFSQAILAGYNSTRVAQALTAVSIAANIPRLAGRTLTGVYQGRSAVITLAKRAGGQNTVRIVQGAGREALPAVGSIVNIGRTKSGGIVTAKVVDIAEVGFRTRVAGSIGQFTVLVGQLMFAAFRADTGPVDNIPLPPE
ncbi:MAG: hypothetical protein AAGG44_18210, partial [Planctomycetota bacterium]